MDLGMLVVPFDLNIPPVTCMVVIVGLGITYSNKNAYHYELEVYF